MQDFSEEAVAVTASPAEIINVAFEGFTKVQVQELQGILEGSNVNVLQNPPSNINKAKIVGSLVVVSKDGAYKPPATHQS